MDESASKRLALGLSAGLMFVTSAVAVGRSRAAPVPAHRSLAAVASRVGRQDPFTSDPSLRTLNSWYLRIAFAAEVSKDPAELQKYAAKMQQFAADKSKPYLWFPATRARTFCLARLKSESAFTGSFATLCQARGNLAHRDRLVPFSHYVFNYLAKHHRAAWVNGAVVSALPQSGPPAGKLYLMLLNARLAQMPMAKDRYRLIHDAIGQAKVWNLKQRAKKHGPLVFSSGLRSLRFVAVRNDAASSDIAHLQADATEYLVRYRAAGRSSPLVFLISEQAYIHAWLLLPKPAQKARIINADGWMANWYPKVQFHAGKLTPQVSHEFAQWRRLEKLAPPGK